MSNEPVDFVITDSTILANPIAGVVVKLFSQDGTSVIGEQVSDSTGTASFLLPSGITYQARFYKFQVNIKNPQFFAVLPAPEMNVFEITGALFSPPASTDSHLCMCYGFFRSITGAPAASVTIEIISKFDPLLFDGAAVMTERVSVQTDANGYVQIPLIRNGQYQVMVASFEDMTRNITVPDASNVNMPDLLFPVVGAIAFDPPGPFTIHVGIDFVVTPTVMATDGETLTGAAMADVVWGTDDPTVAAVLVASDKLILRAFRAGTTNLTAKRANNSIIRYPDPGIAGVPVQITVS